MPSGAKKRKAAKKKKEKESFSASSNQPVSAVDSRGEDDLKHQDDKETDGGEISSPASQDHHSHQQHFTEDEEELEKGDGSSNIVFIEGVKNESVVEQKVVPEEERVVQVEGELKYGEESEKKDVRVDYDEVPEKCYDGGVSGSSSSSRSSSDDESHGYEKSKANVHGTSVDLTKATDALSERSPEFIRCNLVEQAGDSASEKASPLEKREQQNMAAPLDTSEASHVFESDLKEHVEKMKSAEETTMFSAAGMGATPDNEAVEVIVQSSSENATATSDAKEGAELESNDKLTLSYNVPRVNDNGAECNKYSGVPKPVIAPTPPPVQTTSWKSCCGLFELLSGSDR